MSTRPRRTLAGFLARHGAITRHGEPLCTSGLTYLLNNNGLRTLFASFLEERSGVKIPADLRWLSEVVQEDEGRPDLEGQYGDRVPAVKIEAKLGQSFGIGQIRSYAADLATRNRTGDGILGLLVPAFRLEATRAEVAAEFKIADSKLPQRVLEPAVVVAVFSWEEVFQTLGENTSDPAAHDVEQLHGMYLTLAGLDMAPITPGQNWRERESDYFELANRVTRKLPAEHKVYPFGNERGYGNEHGYLRRYIGRTANGKMTFLSIGVRDPFAPHTTPLWLRYLRTEPFFEQILQRLQNSGHALVPSEGHVWLPLNLKEEAAGEELVDDLVAQAESIHRVIAGGR